MDGCSKKQIEYAVEQSKASVATRPSWSILTDIEGQRLVEWITGSSMNDNPVTEDEMTCKVRELLQARRLYNRMKKDGAHRDDAVING